MLGMNARVNSGLRDLSDILARLGVGDGARLASALDIGAYLGQLEGLQLLAAGEHHKLGELLQAAKRLSLAQLDDALAEQRRSGGRLGEILRQRGLLNAAECEVVLAFQQRQCGPARSVTKLYLGNVLVATGEITRAQLADALRWQSQRGGRLGEALVAAGHVSEPQVKRGLQLQRKLVAAVLLAALALVSPFPAKDAQASSSGAVLHSVAAVTGGASQQQSKRNAIRLLIADDHELLRIALRSLLEHEPDIEVVGEAGDGEAMLARASELSPDLVLMDLAMPGLNGIEATRRVTQENPQAKVLVFSTYLERHFVKKTLQNGALGYVSKAAGRDELLRGLRAVAQGNPYLCRETAAMMDELSQDSGTAAGKPALARSEIEVLQHSARGETPADITSRLQLAPGVVEVHLRNAMRKLGLRDFDELKQYALRTQSDADRIP